jgi:hypothetical protein
LFFAAAFTVITLIMRINVHMIVTDLDVAAPQSFVAWILESMRWFLVTGGVLAITVGVMLAFFPAAFRAIEMRANHWYSFRNHSRGSDTMHMSLDRWSESHPRMMGWAIAAGSLVMVAAYGIILFVPG